MAACKHVRTALIARFERAETDVEKVLIIFQADPFRRSEQVVIGKTEVKRSAYRKNVEDYKPDQPRHHQRAPGCRLTFDAKRKLYTVNHQHDDADADHYQYIAHQSGQIGI